MRIVKKILPHINIGLSGMYIIIWILDILNPTMDLISRRSSEVILPILLVITIVNCGLLINSQRKETDKTTDTEITGNV